MRVYTTIKDTENDNNEITVENSNAYGEVDLKITSFAEGSPTKIVYATVRGRDLIKAIENALNT